MLPLRIHCWGGLGSQLLAVALLVDLESKFPSRKFILVLHQGGVTLRESEIDSIFVGVATQPVLDFIRVPTESLTDSKRRHKLKMKDAAKLVLKRLSVTLPLSNDEDFQRIRGFTLSVRGHYSYRTLSKNTIQGLIDKLSESARNVFENGSGYSTGIGVHYRLGDLLTLDTKQPLEETRVVSVVENLLSVNVLEAMTVFSDSPKIAQSIFKKYLPKIAVHSPQATTWEAISNLVHSDYFVGTFSKVSLWIVILRYYSEGEMVSFMPLESRDNIRKFLGSNLDAERVKFY